MKIPFEALLSAALPFIPKPVEKGPSSPTTEAAARARRVRRLTEDAVQADRSAADREARAARRRLEAEHAAGKQRRAEHLKRAAQHDIEAVRHRREAEVARQGAAELRGFEVR